MRSMIVLHGANGSNEEILPLAQALRPYGPVRVPDLLGHGGRPVPDRLSLSAVAQDVIDYLDSRQIARAYFVGYSMGGLIALYLAKHFPDRVCGVCTLATKHVMDEKTVQGLVELADPARPKRPEARKVQLARIHYPQAWEVVLGATQRWIADIGATQPMGEAALRTITVPTLVISGDQDQIVPAAETIALANLLRSRPMLFPGQAHPVTQVPLQAVAREIATWIQSLEALQGAAETVQ